MVGLLSRLIFWRILHMNNYTGTIKRLYAYGLDNELESIDKKVSDKTTSTAKQIAKITGCTDSDKCDDISELLLDVQVESSLQFYDAGFRKAMNIMLDLLAGGAVSNE